MLSYGIPSVEFVKVELIMEISFLFLSLFSLLSC